MRYLMIGGLAALAVAGAGIARAQDGDGAKSRRAGFAGKMLEQKFSEWDKNGDGSLSKDEFPKPEHFDAADADKDGKVTLEEMKQAIRSHIAGRIKGGMEQAAAGRFKRLDSDGDGKVSKAEFEAAFAKLDKDGDGYVTEEEFRASIGGERGRKPVKTEKSE